MKKKNSALFISIVLLIILGTVLIWYFSLPRSVIVSRTLNIEIKQEITDQFIYDRSSDKINIPANLTLYISNIESPGRIRIIIDNSYWGYTDITSEGYANITNLCPTFGCNLLLEASYGNPNIEVGDNFIIIASENFEGELTYTIRELEL